ncbi:MAG: acyl carrier protein [Clostridiales Family XIII bacterium]|jgi:acyl carrier protein|nr:acyl carrier protein [Clostridiales Family XIII bacterium]
MKEDRILEKLEGIFRDFFEDGNLKLCFETTSEDLPSWDSVAHIQLVYEIEDAFDVQFEAEDIMNMTRVRFIVDRLCARVQ